ncbi:unnamed protein product, partial [Urochloa humidicola]
PIRFVPFSPPPRPRAHGVGGDPAVRRPLAPAPAAPGAKAVPVGAAVLEQLGRPRCSSSDTRSRGSMEPKSHINEKKEDIYQRLSTKIDKISDGLDEQARLLKQLEVQIQENNKHAGAIDLTPWVVSMSASFLMVGLYNYVQG